MPKQYMFPRRMLTNCSGKRRTHSQGQAHNQTLHWTKLRGGHPSRAKLLRKSQQLKIKLQRLRKDTKEKKYFLQHDKKQDTPKDRSRGLG